MKRLVPLTALTVLVLTGCASNPETEWSVPLELGDAYTTTNVLSIAEGDGVVVVPILNNVQGFNTAKSELAWSVTLGVDVSQCVPAGSNILCSTGAQTAVAFDRDGNTSELVGVAVEYSGADAVYFAKAYDDRVELVKGDENARLADLGEGDTIAVYDGRYANLPDGTRIERADDGTYPQPIQELVDAGVLLHDSPWLNPPAVAQLGQPLIDGHVIIDGGAVQVTSVDPTTVTLFDLHGTETEEITLDSSLHMSVNPAWTQAEMSGIASEVADLDTSHAFVFSTGEVVGFDRILSDSVAPAFANVEGFELATGEKLAFEPLSPETQGLWVVDYPYISVFGQGPDGQVATTFDVTTGDRVVDGAKCQWTDGSTYCFTADRLEKISSF